MYRNDDILLLINPKAGKMKAKNALFNIVKIFCDNGYNVNVYLTKGLCDATNFIKENGHKYSRIVCCGGDGTLNETITGAVQLETKPMIGYIPCGTTNDFANSLKIPRNLIKAAVSAAGNEYFSIDIGRFNDRYFSYVASFGAFTKVSYSTPQSAKNVLGHLAYLLEGTKELSEIKSYEMKIECDDKTYEGDFIFGAVTNTTIIGGIYKLPEKDININDGVFEIMLVKKPSSILEFTTLISKLIKKDFVKDTNIIFTHAKKVKIYCKTPAAWTLDGEFGGSHKEVEIENLHNAISILRKSKI